MPRVIGIDPGTVSIDLCGLDDGRLFLDRSWPTAEALADPARFVAELEAAGPLDLVVGPSGYGVPITRVQDITEEALRLAFLAAPGETGGIGGLRNLVRALARTALPVVLTPGVVHLPTVPAHRKVNRVDMGTAEKVCAVALAVSDQARRVGSPLSNISLVLLELGGAFTAAVAVAAGRIVDGVGGSAGPLGFRAPGALDGEVAYLAGEVSKALLFRGGAASIAGWDETTASPERLAHPTTPPEQVARDALVESTVKTAVGLAAAGWGWHDARAARRRVDSRHRGVRRPCGVRGGRGRRIWRSRSPGLRDRGACRQGRRAVQRTGRRSGCAGRVLRGRRVRSELRKPPERRARPRDQPHAVGKPTLSPGPSARPAAPRSGGRRRRFAKPTRPPHAASAGQAQRMAREAPALRGRGRRRRLAGRRARAAGELSAGAHLRRDGLPRVRGGWAPRGPAGALAHSRGGDRVRSRWVPLLRQHPRVCRRSPLSGGRPPAPT